MPETHSSSPDTALIVGAGPGIGAAVARRFAEAGYSVGLVARSATRLDQLAATLRDSTGGQIATAAADATDSRQLRSAVGILAGKQGEPSVLCFSPIPDIGLIKPVLETRPDEFMASLALNIGGAATAVHAVLPSMLARGRGSLLFTTGSAALRPDSTRAASGITTTAATTYIALLRDALTGSGVRVGHTVVVGRVGSGDDAHDPHRVADDLWSHHLGRADDFPSVLRLPSLSAGRSGG